MATVFTARSSTITGAIQNQMFGDIGDQEAFWLRRDQHVKFVTRSKRSIFAEVNIKR